MSLVPYPCLLLRFCHIFSDYIKCLDKKSLEEARLIEWFRQIASALEVDIYAEIHFHIKNSFIPHALVYLESDDLA